MKDFGGGIDALAAYAREQGYEFSQEELKEYQDKALRVLKARAEKKLQKPDASLSPGARAFLELIKLAETDEKMAGQLAELGAGNLGEVIAYGKEKGFTFTEEDMKSAGESILEPSDELDEEELKMVAGGDPTITVFTSAVIAGLVVVFTVVIVNAVVRLLVGSKGEK